VALAFDGHAHHRIARSWFDSLPETGDVRICFCRVTQLSFLRLLTTQAVMGKEDVLSQRQAWRVYDRWFEDSRLLFLDEPEGIEKVFRRVSRQTRAASKDWADSYLLAFAEVGEVTLVTLDQGLKQKSSSATLLVQ
jgi:toxin-antitoxin system PIN domain toxin